jgi:hypothetical protein
MRIKKNWELYALIIYAAIMDYHEARGRVAEIID